MTDLSGRVCVVTGASAGIGVETALGLARQGATVVMVGREAAKLGAAAVRVRRQSGRADVTTHAADFASLAAVRRLAAELTEAHPQLHVLVNNAGVVRSSRSVTVDGYETTFAVNHLAPYLLTRLLHDRLVASAPARVVTVSSDAYKAGRLDLDDLQNEHGYKMFRAYGTSKLANALFSHELARRLQGTSVTSNAVHPGTVRTELGRGSRMFGLVSATVGRVAFKSPEEGARTSVHVASQPEGGLVSGEFWSGCKVVETKPAARDDETSARLWRLSAQLVGLTPDGTDGTAA